jgi:hypothetical protein
MPATAPSPNRVPILVVTEPALRLVRRGLLAPSEAAVAARWLGARVLVFRDGPVVYEPPAAPLHGGGGGHTRDATPAALPARAR